MAQGLIGRTGGRQSFTSLGLDTEARERRCRASELSDDEFESKLARKAAAAAEPPSAAIRMHVSAWFTDPADGLPTRRVWAEDEPNEAPNQRSFSRT